MPLWFLGFGNVGTLLAVVSPTKTDQPTNMSLSPFDTALEGRGLALRRREASTCNRVYLEVVNCGEVKVHVRLSSNCISMGARISGTLEIF